MSASVITGCLRIAKESIFTGLNNFKIRTVSDIEFAEYFGFTDSEVKEMVISGEEIEKKIVPELTYADLKDPDINVRETYLWSVMFATGYLTETGKTESGISRLVIPNREIQEIYRDII